MMKKLTSKSLILFSFCMFTMFQSTYGWQLGQNPFRSSFRLYYDGIPINPGDTINISGLYTSTELMMEMDIQNTSSKTLDVLVAKEEMVLITGAQSYFCWFLCYSSSVDTATYPITLLPDQSSSEFSGHLIPANTIGTNTIKYTFYAASNPEDQVYVFVNFISYETEPFDPPQNLSAQIIVPDNVQLVWEAPDEMLNSDNFIGYNIYRNQIKINPFNVLLTSYTDQSVEPGMYNYYITAKYSGGESGPSNPVSIELQTTNIQSITLNPGWNIFSSRAIPDNLDMLNLVQPLIDNDILVKVLDESGGSIFHLPFPPPNGQWSNSIGDLQITDGYYTKVTAPATLEIEGLPVETPLNIPLSSGWNIISYPCKYAQNALDAVQPLIDAGMLVKVINESGGSIFHLPFPPPNGQWSNSIGNFESGKGYYLKVNQNSSLTIDCPADVTENTVAIPERIETSYFHPVYENNPYMPMHVVIAPNEDLQTGDEIGVFDGDICVGATVYDGSPETPIIIITSMDDPNTEIIDGFATGHDIQVSVWSMQTGIEVRVSYTIFEGDLFFCGLGTSIGSIDGIQTGISNLTNHENLISVTPNPATEFTRINLELNAQTNIKIRILNIEGWEIQEIPSQMLNKGTHNIQLDLMAFKKGVYFIRIETQTRTITKNYIYKLIKM